MSDSLAQFMTGLDADPTEAEVIIGIEDHKLGRSPGRPRGAEPVPEYRSKFEPDGEDRLSSSYHGQKAPYHTLKREQPQHREIALLKAQGLTNKEIADCTGYSPVTIAYVTKQPWAVDLIIQEQRSAGRNGVQRALQQIALPAVEKLIELMEDTTIQSKTPDTTRKAANDLLNRIYGMPSQSIIHSEKVELDKMTDQELADFVAKGRGVHGAN